MSRRAPRIWRRGDPLAPLAETVARGGILAVPTESSYGLGADPRNPQGVAAVYRVKGRPPDQPLPVVVADPGQLAALGIDPESPEVAWLARRWPAPLAGLLPLAAPLPAAAGGSTLAVRVPAHPGLRELLQALGHGLTATSANRSGAAPALGTPEAAELVAGEDAWVVDGGDLPGGPPSTLVAFEAGRVRVIRAGRFPVDRLQERLN